MLIFVCFHSLVSSDFFESFSVDLGVTLKAFRVNRWKMVENSLFLNVLIGVNSLFSVIRSIWLVVLLHQLWFCILWHWSSPSLCTACSDIYPKAIWYVTHHCAVDSSAFFSNLLSDPLYWCRYFSCVINLNSILVSIWGSSSPTTHWSTWFFLRCAHHLADLDFLSLWIVFLFVFVVTLILRLRVLWLLVLTTDVGYIVLIWLCSSWARDILFHFVFLRISQTRLLCQVI